jgi:DNA-binding transcriptional ArsR family regulator
MTYQNTSIRTIEALADPTRRSILERLRAGPGSVGAIAQGLPVSRPAVSQHLKILGQAGLVRHETQGTRHIYKLQGDGIRALRDYLDTLWDDTLAAFAAHARQKETEE